MSDTFYVCADFVVFLVAALQRTNVILYKGRNECVQPTNTHAHINKLAVTVFVALWQNTKRAVRSVLGDII